MQQRRPHPVTHSKNKDFYYLPSTYWVNVHVLYITQVAHYVWNKKDFDAVDPETTDYLMGEFLFIYFLLRFSFQKSDTWKWSVPIRPLTNTISNNLVYAPA